MPAPFDRDAPEAAEAHSESAQIVQAFLLEVAPKLDDARRMLAGKIMKNTLASAGSSFFRHAAHRGRDRGLR